MMNTVGRYGNYQSTSYVNNRQRTADRTNQNTRTKETDETKKKKITQLSDRAKALLENLKKQHSNMSFIVADYSSDEEAQRYLAMGTAEFSVLIDPETLEEMAADKDVQAKYENLLNESSTDLQDMLKKLGPDADQVTKVGVSIDKEGTVTYFAELEKLSAGQRERIEQSRANKAEQAAKDAKKAEQSQKAERYQVKASSVRGLLEQIRNAAARDRWESRYYENQKKEAGSQVDYTA